MRFIPTRLHGLLDYAMGVLLILSPVLFDFGAGGAETIVPLALGVTLIVYSLATNYEFGVGRVLSMRTHLGLDALSGALLAVSPWLLGFAGTVYLPHVLLGIAEIGAALLTRTEPDFAAMRQRRG